ATCAVMGGKGGGGGGGIEIHIFFAEIQISNNQTHYFVGVIRDQLTLTDFMSTRTKNMCQDIIYSMKYHK
ncbi:hypothetical protein ACJX0J_019411, partial [Zea mays]